MSLEKSEDHESNDDRLIKSVENALGYFKGNILSTILNAFIVVGTLTILTHYVPYFREISPFRAEVWGTVSDWAMVVVTIISVVTLIYTLRHQMGINKVEFEKRALGLKPHISIRLNEKFNSKNQFKLVSFSFLTKVNPYSNFAFCFFDLDKNNHLRWDYEAKTGPIDGGQGDNDILMYDDIHLDISDLFDKKRDPRQLCAFVIFYRDLIGNVYIERFKLEILLYDVPQYKFKRYPMYKRFDSFQGALDYMLKLHRNQISEKSLESLRRHWKRPYL